MVNLTLITILIAAPIILLAILLFVLRLQILSFLKPEDYCLVEMLEKDNNCHSWIQKKTNDLEFFFNDGRYNMFDLVGELPKGETKQGELTPPPYFKKVFSSIYREGRLAKLFYKEGEQNPLDFRNLRIINDAQQSNQIEKIQLSRLIHGGQSLGAELFSKYGFWILVIIGIVVMYVAFKGAK